MTRSLTARLLAASLIIIVGLALFFALDDGRAQAQGRAPDEGARLGQSQGLFFASRPGADGTLFLSRDGRQWRELAAEFEGEVLAVAPDDLASDTYFVATDRALLVTTDAGASWQPLSAAIEGSVVALQADGATAGTVYAVTDGGALYRLSAGGATVERLSGPTVPSGIRDLAWRSAPPQTLFAATDEGLFRSASAGQQWERVATVPSASEVLVSASDSNTLYVASRDSGLFRSTDGGETWEPASEGLGAQPGVGLAVTALAEDPTQPGTLYVATAYVLGHTTRQATPAGLFLSPDGGTQWIRVAEMRLSDPVVTDILPEQGVGSGIRAVSGEGVQLYRLDPDRALAQLGSDDPATRLEGAKVLSVAAVPTQADALLPYLSADDGELAYYIARALGHMGGERATAALVELVEGDADSIVKLRALLALQGIADEATVPTLAGAFQEAALARAAADALAAIATPAAWQPLTAALADRELTAQRQAAMAAFEANPRAAVPALLPLLNEDDPVVRANVAQALAWTGDEAAIRPVRALLDDTEPTVRASAAFALGELGDAQSVSRLQALSLNDANPAVREAATQAIVQAQRVPAQTEAAQPAPQGWTERLPGGVAWLRALVLGSTAALAILVLAARAPRRPAQV